MHKRAVLWVSGFAPYDKVTHAGGKTHNFYIKGLHKSGMFNIKLITFADEQELPKIDLKDYGIDHDIIVNRLINRKRNILKRIFIQIWDNLHRRNLLSLDAGTQRVQSKHNALTRLRALKRSGYVPDVIVLQWTQIIFLRKYIADIFPGVPIVAIEEDVDYLGHQRRTNFYPFGFRRCLEKVRYFFLKRCELQVLHDSTLAVVNNVKDERLLRTDGTSINIWRWVPYFDSYIKLEHKGGTRDIIFYGAMDRSENYLSAEWFIKNVMPLLSGDYRFIVIGNNPSEKIMQYKSDRVIITGFVDDPSQYFQSALCFAAPLLFGAGVKVKILEALSAGLPVLTNRIGIEGIEAVDGESYFHCETPQEYADTIRRLGSGEIDSEKVSEASKTLIREKYNYHDTLKQFIDIMASIA